MQDSNWGITERTDLENLTRSDTLCPIHINPLKQHGPTAFSLALGILGLGVGEVSEFVSPNTLEAMYRLRSWPRALCRPLGSAQRASADLSAGARVRQSFVEVTFLHPNWDDDDDDDDDDEESDDQLLSLLVDDDEHRFFPTTAEAFPAARGIQRTRYRR